METTKKDYFHLYLGSFVITDSNEIGQMVGMIIDGKLGLQNMETRNVRSHPVETCKLILRPLCNMSEAEALEITKIVHGGYEAKKATFILPAEEWIVELRGLRTNFVPNRKSAWTTAEQLRYMIKREFDVFGLVSKGFAVYNDHSIDFAILDAALSTKNT